LAIESPLQSLTLWPGLCQQLLAKQPAPYSDGSDISSALLAWNST